MTFDLIPLRLHFTAPAPIHFPRGAANLLRGELGKAWMRDAPEAYARWFSPEKSAGPSGLRDAPRPFVFRAAHLNDISIARGDPFYFGINVFQTREPMIDLFARAFEPRFGSIQKIEGTELLHLPITPAADGVRRVAITFVTPTELKGVEHENDTDFATLFARIRDRVSTLRALYGDGPLEIDFKATGERAESVKIVRSSIEHVTGAKRLSSRTGQRHTLGGFVGEIEYAGDLDEFVPYLEIARWTGVGRQTVWGKGEIAWRAI